MRTKRRRVPIINLSRKIVILCFCLIALACIHCRRRNDRTSLDDSKVTVLHKGDERIFLGLYWGMEAQLLMFLPLVTIPDDVYGEPQPGLATSWEHSSDYKSWTFHLRTDVRWHDGVPVTAHDIKYTFDLFEFLEISPAESATVVDDSTVVISYKEPTNALDWWTGYYPKHLLEGLDLKDFWKWEFWVRPVGNAPYRYVRHVPKTMVELEANPDYYRGKPKIERVVLKFAQEPSIIELLSGNVDALTYVSRDLVLNLSADDRFRSYYWWGGSWLEVIYWNHNHRFLGEAKVRRALTMAINRKELAVVLNYPEGVPICDTICTSRQLRGKRFPDPLPYDPEQAKQILEEVGWHDTDRDGIRERNGEKLRFKMVVPSVSIYEHAGVYIQEMFRKIGVRMELQTVDTSIVRQLLRSGDFDAVMNRFRNFTEHLEGHLTYLGEKSSIGYMNTEMVRLLNLAKNAMEPDEKDRIYREIMPIFRADLPITLLLPQVQTHIVHRRIKGLSNLNRPDPVWFMEHLWIEEESGEPEEQNNKEE